MNKIIKLIVLLTFCAGVSANAQSSNFRAQGNYYSAKEQYSNKNYEEALNYVYKSKQALDGTNIQLQYLHVVSAYHAGKYDEAQKELAVFFQINEEKVAAKPFDKSVDPLTNDEIKEITKLIDKVDESAGRAHSEEEQRQAQQRAANAKEEAGKNKLDNLGMGGVYLGMPQKDCLDMMNRKLKGTTATTDEVNRLIRDFDLSPYYNRDTMIRLCDDMSSILYDRIKNYNKYSTQQAIVKNVARAVVGMQGSALNELVPDAIYGALDKIRFRNGVVTEMHWLIIFPASSTDMDYVSQAFLRAFGTPISNKTVNSDAIGDRTDMFFTGNRTRLYYFINLPKYNGVVDKPMQLSLDFSTK